MRVAKKHLPPDLGSYNFFKESDPAQIKYEMLRDKMVSNKSVVQVCKDFNFTRKTFYDTLERFKQEGMVGLLDKTTGPQKRHKVDPELEKAIIRIKREHLSDHRFKVPQVFQTLKDEYVEKGLEVTISVKTVERVLIDHGLHEPRPKKNG